MKQRALSVPHFWESCVIKSVVLLVRVYALKRELEAALDGGRECGALATHSGDGLFAPMSATGALAAAGGGDAGVVAVLVEERVDEHARGGLRGGCGCGYGCGTVSQFEALRDSARRAPLMRVRGSSARFFLSRSGGLVALVGRQARRHVGHWPVMVDFLAHRTGTRALAALQPHRVVRPNEH